MAESSEGSVCVVTGATSGIGLAVTRRLIAARHRVVGVGRHQPMMDELGARWPGRFQGLVHDVRHGGLAAAIRASGVPLAAVDLVVHCAGCARQGSALADMSESDIREMLETNVLGTTLVAREMSAVLRDRGGGTLVVLGSVAGYDAAPRMAVYSASKAYVHQLLRCLRADLLGSGVKLACILPGSTRTALLDGQPGLGPAQRYAGFAPLEADDVAAAVEWVHAQPAHVNVQELSLYPTAQSLYVRGVHRTAEGDAARASATLEQRP